MFIYVSLIKLQIEISLFTLFTFLNCVPGGYSTRCGRTRVGQRKRIRRPQDMAVLVLRIHSKRTRVLSVFFLYTTELRCVAVYTMLIATFANDKRTLLPHFYAEHWRLRDKINMRFYVNDKSIVSFRMHCFDLFRDLHVNPFILRNCNKYLYYEHGYVFPPFFVNDLSNCGISV